MRVHHKVYRRFRVAVMVFTKRGPATMHRTVSADCPNSAVRQARQEVKHQTGRRVIHASVVANMG